MMKWELIIRVAYMQVEQEKVRLIFLGVLRKYIYPFFYQSHVVR